MTHTFISGAKGEKPRSDLRVKYAPSNKPLIVKVDSSVKSFFGNAILKQANLVCKDLKIDKGTIEIEDFGAVPFVIAARIEAVIKKAHPDLNLESLPTMKDFCLGDSTRDRFRRSRLYLPGNQPKLMLNAGIHNPDGIILDLEDAVSPPEKVDTRFVVRNALRSIDFFGAERMIRINQGELGLIDLEYIIPHNAHLVLIPKVEHASTITEIDNRIKEISEKCGRTTPVFLMPIIESGRGVLKALEIAEASPNIVALAIGLEDYTADLGVPRTQKGDESFFARSMIINAARAVGIQAIDTVYSDVGNEEGLRESVREAKSLGFDGKGCIHPRQIKPLHEEFAPSVAEVEKAQKIVEAFKEADKKGLGVVSLGSKMIDPPVVKRALHTVKLAEMTEN
jgi:citrate lyase subunit beta/citryl-CoA lyase